MSSMLNVFLVGLLLHGSMCELSVSLPKQIQALPGSCVTIPCSFQINPRHKNKLNNCKGGWSYYTNKKTSKQLQLQMMGDLAQKNCTTILHDITFTHSGYYYYFNLNCGTENVWETLNIDVKAEPPTPKLTPHTLEVKVGTPVSVQCTALVLCLSQPPALTWSPMLGNNEEILLETQDKTYVKVSTLNFTASPLHHKKSITCTAAYTEKGSAVSSKLKPNVTFTPKILTSTNCTVEAAQIVCLCETVGNPFPTLLWHFNGASANYSISEPLSDTALRSVITLHQPQPRHPLTVVCHSSNSLGSDSQTFYLSAFEHETPAQQKDVLNPVLTAIVAALLALVCVLLFVIRGLNVCRKVEPTAVLMEQLPELNESQTQRCTVNVMRPDPTSADGEGSKCTRESVIYCNVNRKNKIKVQAAGDTQPSCSSSLEQQKSVVGDMSRSAVSNALNMGHPYHKVNHANKTEECQYALINFIPTTGLHQ